MANIKYNIFEIDADNLSRLEPIYDDNLKNILESVEVTGTFIPSEDFIELSFFTLDNTRLSTIKNFNQYSILSGDKLNNSTGNSEIAIDPLADYERYFGDGSELKALYHFLRNPFLVAGVASDFTIESISPDRREVRLIPTRLNPFDVERAANRIKRNSVESQYGLELYLYCDDNTFYSCINIDYSEFNGTTAVLLRLGEPLPRSIQNYKVVSIVEKVSNSVAFEINVEIIPEKPEIPTLRGANFNVEIENQSTEPSQYYNYNELFSFPTNNTYRELNTLFNEKGAELGIEYNTYSNFINFSSAEERLRNFKYKLDLINSYQTSLDNINTTGTNYTGTGITGSRVYYENLLNGVVNNFDHYERHLYFESGSTSWPKTNNTKPYINQESANTEATDWYNAELGDAILYDAQNPDILINTIPAYLKEDTNNRPYELFIHMIAQHFDNLWIYTDAVSKKYDADNRLTRGVSKDLVEELLKNFGIKLYTSNKSVEDLFRYFTLNSYNAGEEHLPSGITTSGEPAVSQNDYQKEIYKRIYHNLPLLLKSKGTERGVRALINCFGIPSDVLKIKIYGGQSANDLPFYGGEQAWTGSLDKVRLDNTGSIVEGDTLSFYTSIIKEDNKYTQDLHRIEIGFSPADNINSYIVSQSAVLFPDDPFNIDNYIGDPREVNTNVYRALRDYADQIFDGVGYYNLKDFVRLIKFFDNVIFRMVRDFVPGRSVTDSGIIIKPHLLERSKYTSPVMTWTRPEYSGSVDTAFISGSNAGAYKNIGVGSIGTNKFRKESSTRTLHSTPTPLGRRGLIDKLHQEPKFNGELSGSGIRVTNGELNSGNPFKNLEYPTVVYTVQFYKEVPDNICALDLSQLSTFVIDPNSSGGNFEAFNLGNLFPGSNGLYDYIVNSNGVETTLTGLNVNFDFLVGGNYEQYQVFNVEAFHENNNTTFNGTCQNDREVIIVECNITTISANVPTQVVPLETHDLNTWWNSTTSPNTDITYLINGESYSPAEVTNFEFEETEFVDGQDIVVTIQDNNNPSGCKLEIEVQYSNCTLSLIEEPFGTNTNNQYIPPYNFAGVLENTTTYSFRLEWCGDTGVGFGGGFGFCEEADYNGYWINIDPNNPVTTGELTEILALYPGANPVNPDESITPLPSQFTTFTSIQFYLDNPYVNSGFIRMRFRAQNSQACVLEHTQTVVVGSTPDPIEVNQLLIAHSTTLNAACCETNNINVYTTAPSVYALLHENIFFVPQPPAIYQDEDRTVYAPGGWYTDGEVARRWNNVSGFWGGTTSFPPGTSQTDYIDCSNNIHITELC